MVGVLPRCLHNIRQWSCDFRSSTCSIRSPLFVISFKTAAVACYDQMHLSIGRPPAKSSRLPDSFWKFVENMERKAGHAKSGRLF